MPKTYCEIHEVVAVCPDSFKLANPTCINTVGTVNISRINRHYAEGEPTVQPTDYEYEVPTTYCEYHYCAKDEEGNWIYDYNNEPEGNDETNSSGETNNSGNNDGYNYLNPGWWGSLGDEDDTNSSESSNTSDNNENNSSDNENNDHMPSFWWE